MTCGHRTLGRKSRGRKRRNEWPNTAADDFDTIDLLRVLGLGKVSELRELKGED